MQKLKMRMNLDKDRQIKNRGHDQLPPDQTIEAKVEARVKSEFAKYMEEERARKELEEKTRKEIEEKTKKEMEEKAKEDKSKVAKFMEDAKKQREKLEIEKAKVIDETPVCPTCHSHVHKTVTNGTRVKCVGPDCPKEYELVDMTSDLQCLGCGAPMKHENVKNADDGCPFCGGKKAKKFDWGKVWKIPKTTTPKTTTPKTTTTTGTGQLGGLGIGGLGK